MPGAGAAAEAEDDERLVELAKQLGSVSQACKVMGCSHGSFYRFKELYERGGPQGDHAPQAGPAQPGGPRGGKALFG
jgi:hypothetical protein